MKTRTHRNTDHAPRARRGSASLAAILAAVLLLGLSAAILTASLGSRRERRAMENLDKAFLVANAGISHGVSNLSAGIVGDLASPFSDGDYAVAIVDNGDDTYTLTSTGEVRGERVSVEAVAVPSAGGIFANAIFAGNTAGNPLYSIELGGTAQQADEVYGNVYSGANVGIVDDASVSGMIRAVGNIVGAGGEATAPTQPIPDLVTPDYASTADYDVRQMFLDGQASGDAKYASSPAGGQAWQLPDSDPAHIFRLNPSDRSTETASTPKDDYFLEDPYEKMAVDRNQNGSDPYHITLSGTNGMPGPDGNQKVYYIDGNLWLHNKASYSFQFYNEDSEGVQITFVVKGNIYFSDNLFYHDEVRDGVAFIAMKDPAEPDSGNVYFGDPRYGTLREMHAYMYAEDTFHDVSLDQKGSAVVELLGIMSAGDEVAIQRDYGNQHTKLVVDFDARVTNGTISLPGLPPQSGVGGADYRVASWRRVALP